MKQESINFVIKAFYNSSTILNQNGEVHLIDNFSIPLELKPLNYFSSPIDINGAFDIGSFTIAYRIQCGANYYGPDCLDLLVNTPVTSMEIKYAMKDTQTPSMIAKIMVSRNDNNLLDRT